MFANDAVLMGRNGREDADLCVGLVCVCKRKKLTSNTNKSKVVMFEKVNSKNEVQ